MVDYGLLPPEINSARIYAGPGVASLSVTNSTMKDFCDGMQGAVMDKPIVDHTGLTDRYDFQLNWTADESQFAAMGVRDLIIVDTPDAVLVCPRDRAQEVKHLVDELKDLGDKIDIRAVCAG